MPNRPDHPPPPCIFGHNSSGQKFLNKFRFWSAPCQGVLLMWLWDLLDKRVMELDLLSSGISKFFTVFVTSVKPKLRLLLVLTILYFSLWDDFLPMASVLMTSVERYVVCTELSLVAALLLLWSGWRHSPGYLFHVFWGLIVDQTVPLTWIR